MRLFGLVFTLFFLFISQDLLSQETDMYEYYKKLNPSSANHYNTEQQYKREVDVNITFGSSFSYFGNDSKGLFSYIIPELHYNVNPKLSLNSGIIFGNHSFRNVYIPTSETIAKSDLRYSSMFLFTEAEYKMNEKLRISGMILYNMNQDNAFSSAYEQPFNRLEYSFRGEYKLTDYLHFGFEISKRNYSRYQNSSLFGPSYYTPYGGRRYPYMW